METDLKKRLIGAAILIALAVIFIPMVLDGAGYEARLTEAPRIPPPPVLPRPALPPPDLQMIPPPEEPAVRINQRESLPSSLAGIPPASTPAPAPAPVAPQTDLNPRPLSGWAVQVHSFGQESTALNEKQRLQALGLAVFVEPFARDGRQFFRVKVGPFAERSEAHTLQQRLRNEHNLDGILVSYP